MTPFSIREIYSLINIIPIMKQNRTYKFTCIAIVMLLWNVPNLYSQQTSTIETQQVKAQLEQRPDVAKVIMSEERQTASFIHLKQDKVLSSHTDAITMLQDLYALDANDYGLTFDKVIPFSENLSIKKYDQSYKGVKIDHGTIKIIQQGDGANIIHGEVYQINPTINMQPKLDVIAAKAKAHEFVDADIYAEEELELLKGRFNSTDQLNEINKLIAEYDPKGELVIVDNYYTSELDLDLAWKFSIYAARPLSRDWIYVNAHSGEIMLRNAIMKHGHGDTRYSGNQDFPTTEVMGQFELKGFDSVSGVFCETRSLDGLGGIPLSVTALYSLSEPVVDNDDNFTEAEHRPMDLGNGVGQCTYMPMTPPPAGPTGLECNEANNDDVALDAQYGASIVTRYWHLIHNRSSYDNEGTPIRSFVHYGDAYDNAFWNGSVMTYGDGSHQGGAGPNSPGFAPLTSMDVCAHEIGHAVCTATSDLIYQRESGAMNEGFSDIWGACVENFVLMTYDSTQDYQVFGIGEQIDERDNGVPPSTSASRALRWMDDPHAEDAPDTYGGLNWEEPECGEPSLANDNCGVHTNSGVLNKWFYLLVKGSGQTFSPGLDKVAADDQINDNGASYSVSSLGFGKAELITFLGEIMLTSNAKFADMRNASIVATQILYGPCSFEEEQVTNAWHAVGVDTTFQACSPIIDFNDFANSPNALEQNSIFTCTSSNDFDIVFYSFQSSETASLTFSGTAIENVDYVASTNSLVFQGTELKTLTLSILNDAVIESDETIIVTMTSPSFSSVDTFTIIDDDIVPNLGSATLTLIDETFDNSTIPTGWTRVTLNPESAVDWQFNGASEMGRAYVTDNNSGSASYSGGDSHVAIRSPKINAIGLSDVHVVFDWMAGGEFDGEIFDYGSFVISFDGTSFKDLALFHGPSVGMTASGTYDEFVAELGNREFYIGFKWYNDALVNGSYSFSVDNVTVEALPTKVESDLGHSRGAVVLADSAFYLTSEQDADLLVRIEDANTDLLCVTASIRDINPAVDTVAYLGGLRSSKIVDITDAEENVPYTLTLYYSSEDIADWNSDLSLLNVIVVRDTTITNIGHGFSIIGTNDIVVDDQLASNDFISYTFPISGNGIFALTDVSCIDILDIPEVTLASGDYIASQVINAKGLVPAASLIHFRSGNEVNLQSSFEVEVGGELLVIIDDCPDK